MKYLGIQDYFGYKLTTVVSVFPFNGYTTQNFFGSIYTIWTRNRLGVDLKTRRF